MEPQRIRVTNTALTSFTSKFYRDPAALYDITTESYQNSKPRSCERINHHSKLHTHPPNTKKLILSSWNEAIGKPHPWKRTKLRQWHFFAKLNRKTTHPSKSWNISHSSQGYCFEHRTWFSMHSSFFCKWSQREPLVMQSLATQPLGEMALRNAQGGLPTEVPSYSLGNTVK